MVYSSSSEVSLKQLSRQQGFWVIFKSYMAGMALMLCAILCSLPGIFMLCKWHGGIVAIILGGTLCLIGVLGSFILCLRKCSPVVQGMLLLRMILMMLGWLGVAIVAVVLWNNATVRDYLRLLQ